nr:pre-rRNA-processing protein TSR2 homolog [Ipomoea batatas]
MDFKNHAPPQLTVEAEAQLQEGINLVLSRWASLQMAVANEWGGRGSAQKSQELSERIFSFFTQSKEQVYIDDLEEILDEFMLSDFNTEVGDGSIEEVAEKMMIMHEECTEDMAVDGSEHQGQKDMMVDEPRTNGGAETEDGWTVVSSRRKNELLELCSSTRLVINRIVSSCYGLKPEEMELVEIIIGSIAVGSGNRFIVAGGLKSLVGDRRMPHIISLLSVKDRKKGFVQPVPSSTAKMSQEERFGVGFVVVVDGISEFFSDDPFISSLEFKLSAENLHQNDHNSHVKPLDEKHHRHSQAHIDGEPKHRNDQRRLYQIPQQPHLRRHVPSRPPELRHHQLNLINRLPRHYY